MSNNPYNWWWQGQPPQSSGNQLGQLNTINYPTTAGIGQWVPLQTTPLQHPPFDWQELLRQYEIWKKIAKPVELPDEFDSWVEEVRRQNRIEELLNVLCAHCLPKEQE